MRIASDAKKQKKSPIKALLLFLGKYSKYSIYRKYRHYSSNGNLSPLTSYLSPLTSYLLPLTSKKRLHHLAAFLFEHTGCHGATRV